MEPPSPAQFTEESKTIFAEGISLVLSRWASLQMAIQNEWGGRNSLQKSHQLASDIFSWFFQTKDFYIDDLEDLLFENMRILFNVELDDGSEEEIAADLTTMYEECLQQTYETVLRLRASKTGAEAVARSQQLVNEDETDESSDDGNDASDMVMDEQKDVSINNQAPPVEQAPVEPDDGWTVVPSRKNKGNRR